MTQIYCLTELNDKMEQQGCELFMSLEGVVKWLEKTAPIDNKMCVTDSDIAGYYDITVDNLDMLVTECKKQNMAASFTINSNFFAWTITSKYTLSTIDVHE